MPKIRRGGQIPDGEDPDFVPRDIFSQPDIKGLIFIGLIKGLVGDGEPGGNVIKINSRGAPPVDLQTGQHVKLGNSKRAIVDYLDDSAKLVLDHLDLGLKPDEGARVGACPTQIQQAQDEEKEDVPWKIQFGQHRVWDPDSIPI